MTLDQKLSVKLLFILCNHCTLSRCVLYLSVSFIHLALVAIFIVVPSTKLPVRHTRAPLLLYLGYYTEYVTSKHFLNSDQKMVKLHPDLKNLWITGLQRSSTIYLMYLKSTLLEHTCLRNPLVQKQQQQQQQQQQQYTHKF